MLFAKKVSKCTSNIRRGVQIKSESGLVSYLVLCHFIYLGGTGDTIPPVITGCPSDIMEPGSMSVRVQWSEPTASDNSGVTPARTRSHIPGAFFHVGLTEVTYTFTDDSGNRAVCSFSVFVSGTHFTVC